MADVIRVNTETMQVEYDDTPIVKAHAVTMQVEYDDTPIVKAHAVILQVEYTTASTSEEAIIPGFFFCHG